MRAIVAIIAAAFLTAACAAPARVETPTPAALRGDYFAFQSEALGRAMHIHVALPENYAAQREAYPVVYLTDGDSLFPLLAPTQLFLTYDEPVPPAIIVGIAYGSFDPNAGNLRHIDFTTPAPGAPGADAFQRFLAEELIPEVERRYRANPERRVLVGQSRGAGFVLYSALTAPDLFWGRIASNPAMRPSMAAFPQEAAPATRADLRLFLASGARDRADLRADAQAWSEHWRAAPARPWAFNNVTIANGTHAATVGEVYRQGMICLFSEEAAVD